MGVFKGEDGKLYIDSKSFNYDIFFRYVKPQNEFSKKYHVSKQVLHELRERKPPSYDLITKLCRMIPDLSLQELLNDYNEEEYEDLDLDLNNMKPTLADINDTIKHCKSRMATIKTILNQSEISVEKRTKLFEVIERLMLECQYLGIQLNKINQDEKIIKKVLKERTERGV